MNEVRHLCSSVTPCQFWRSVSRPRNPHYVKSKNVELVMTRQSEIDVATVLEQRWKKKKKRGKEERYTRVEWGHVKVITSRWLHRWMHRGASPWLSPENHVSQQCSLVCPWQIRTFAWPTHNYSRLRCVSFSPWTAFDSREQILIGPRVPKK